MNLHLLDFLISSLTSRITSHWINSQAFENEQTPHSSLILAFTSLFCNLSRKRSASPGVASSSSVHEISRPKGISSSSNSSHSSVPSCRTRAREADSAMTDVARRREATAGSHIGSRADKASTPDRKPLEALKAAAAAAPGPDDERPLRRKPDRTERSKLSRQLPVWIRKRFRKDGRCSPPTRQGRHAKDAGSEGAGSSQSSSRSEGGAGQERKLEAQAVHSAHGPCDQNRRQGKGNPEEHSQPIGYGPEADKGQGARKSRQTE